MDDLQKARKQLVFILNYALDLKNKNIIEGDDLMYFSNEVKNFRKITESLDIPVNIKNSLYGISFDYSPTRANLSLSLPVIIIFSFFSFGIFLLFLYFQNMERKRMLNSFLNKYDEKLKLFEK